MAIFFLKSCILFSLCNSFVTFIESNFDCFCLKGMLSDAIKRYASVIRVGESYLSLNFDMMLSL